ncbi:TetR/AcrR family transcriptional regulator [Streptomyces sp. M19]
MPSEKRRLHPRKQPRQLRAELTRQRILTAAAHVFADYGYAAGTTNRIAERARISIGSLYQYYPNKDAILVELLSRHLDRGAAAVSRYEHDRTPTPSRGSSAATYGPPSTTTSTTPAPAGDGRAGARSAELWDRVSGHHRERVAQARELFGGHPEVHVEDVDTAARLVVSAIELLVHHLVADPEPIDVARLENELVAMLTRYLTAARPGQLGDGRRNRPVKENFPPPTGVTLLSSLFFHFASAPAGLTDASSESRAKGEK